MTIGGHHVLQCSCGWHFIARYANEKYCPQCLAPTEHRCACCGKKIKKYAGRVKYCDECSGIVEKIQKRERAKIYGKLKKSKLAQRIKEKVIDASIKLSDDCFTSDCGVTGMDCEHCPYPDDCILDVDEG